MHVLYSHVGPDNIGELLRRNRHVAGLSVREAAEQAGVSHATFSRVENDGKPSLTT
jgi:transcriptional regulator with XRE-family HTH domain